MATTREQEAANYLEKHKIIELMDNLTSMLFFYRPERPQEFLITQLERLQMSKIRSTDTECPSLFNDSNLDAVFGIMDPTKQGYITFVQYKEALTTLGIKKVNECPEGLVQNKISHHTFKREAKEGLQQSCATFLS